MIKKMCFSHNQLHMIKIEKWTKMIRNDCSTGYDDIPTSFMKPISEFLVSPKTFIMNNVIKTNQFQDIWKYAKISPIPEIQLPVELKDYRPVFILPILSKIYERVVLEQITNFIEKKLIYHHYQSVYCKNHATATLLAKLRDGIKKAMKTREIILAVLTDYSKVFDSIDFSVLIKKMHTLSFSKFFLYWTFSYLTDRPHFV